MGSLDFKQRSTPSFLPSSSLLLVNKCQINDNRNANENVSRNVSREPNFRYTTILLKKLKEKKRNVSREPDFRYTTILSSKMKENDIKEDPDDKETYRKRLHIPQNQKYRKIQVSPGARRSRCSFLKKCFVFRKEKNATVKQRVWEIRYAKNDS